MSSTRKLIEVVSPKRGQPFSLLRIHVEVLNTGKLTKEGKVILEDFAGGENDLYQVVLKDHVSDKEAAEYVRQKTGFA